MSVKIMRKSLFYNFPPRIFYFCNFVSHVLCTKQHNNRLKCSYFNGMDQFKFRAYLMISRSIQVHFCAKVNKYRY